MRRTLSYLIFLAAISLLSVSCVSLDESKKLGEDIIILTIQQMEYGDASWVEGMVSCSGHIITKACKHPDRNVQKYCFQNAPCHRTGLEYFFRGPFEPNQYIFLTASGAGNFYYNVAYLANLPANLIAEIHFDWSKDEDSFLIFSIIKNCIYAFYGFFVSFFMLFIGGITGLIFHPINTFFECVLLLPNFFVAIWSAVTNFFEYTYIFFTINPWTV